MARFQLLEVIDLNADLMPTNIDPAFQKAAEIDRVNDITFKDISVRCAGWFFEMQSYVFGSQTYE